MEKLKNDEKAKHANRPNYYNQGCAFSIIALMFLLLTIITSYETFKVLPVPVFFWYGSMGLGMLIFAFLVLLGSVWGDTSIPLNWLYVIGALLLVASPLIIWKVALPIGIMGSWFAGMIYILLFRHVPVVVFPLLLIATFCVAMLCQRKSVNLPRMEMKLITYPVVLFTCIFIWGHALKFESQRYDEGLKVNGNSYHAIVYYGWLGDPGLVFLYECDEWIFGCELLYESDYDNYEIPETQLVFDESASTLRLEYHLSERNAQHYDIPPILYEHPIQQE
jgi:hypothetical protein